jgi:squalene-hopene/tetraprenyl-beta-curcumene cyclase
MPVDPTRIADCYRFARERLLAERNERGHWEGELSTSALSTATAVMALEMVRRDRATRTISSDDLDFESLIANGLCWLAEHQNEDGGWGDTVKSFSNISTTMLARAVFHATGNDETYAIVVDPAAKYIERIGGVPAVVKRYGKDHTFSIPILTHCALAGLVDWQQVPFLPFELACLPPKFYKTVRLPVVSYALPALIGIGQVGYHHRKPWNPITRVLRKLAIKPSLRTLERIQPPNGGFLEATPLTSFVTMSLAGMGRSDHTVAQKGISFIANSVRKDGSWPIDTNLATWVTTLSVNALGDDLPVNDRPAISDWLHAQQYKEVHPYTNADPGGWSWTDLPGGVPDADDTPGAILALLSLASGRRKLADNANAHGVTEHDDDIRGLTPPARQQVETAVRNGVAWLLGVQNGNGGFPTFCRGWGTLPFDRSSPDITAHCLRAIHESLPLLDPNSTSLIRRAITRGFRFLNDAQRPDGSWLPLWFGNQHGPDDENPLYGTTRVLAAYRDCDRLEIPEAQRGLDWLIANQNEDGGWGGSRGIASSNEETALAVEILLSTKPETDAGLRGLEWLMARIEADTFTETTPIGFYFAKLWYFERLYPLSFMVGAMRQAVLAYGREESASPSPVTTAKRQPSETDRVRISPGD